MSTISKSGGMAKFLAMLFAFLITFSLCAAAPTLASKNIEDKQLAIRAPTLKEENKVGMGETKFFSFGVFPTSYWSPGFGNCVGVLIAGNKGAIIGHYTPTGSQLGIAMPNDPLESHIYSSGPNAAAIRIPALFTANSKAFKDGLKVFIYTVVMPDNTLKFPQETAALATFLRTTTGVQPTIVHYSQATAEGPGGRLIVTSKAFAGYTTDFVA